VLSSRVANLAADIKKKEESWAWKRLLYTLVGSQPTAWAGPLFAWITTWV
jgi:hypothetical protein